MNKIKNLFYKNSLILSLVSLVFLVVVIYFLQDIFLNKTQYSSNKFLSTKITTFYQNNLKPLYEKGYYVDVGNIGTSESQSYALLQAYLEDDKATFDKVWQWTKNKLQNKNNSLFYWKFSIGVRDTTAVSDLNSATDADTDIAYALIKAGEKWSEKSYISEAKNIINSLWNVETTNINNKRIVIAGNWAADNSTDYIVVNPSYFSPQAYRLFSIYDKDHDWIKLIKDNYEIITKISDNNFGNTARPFLPPDWAKINKSDESILQYEKVNNSIDYSYDAFRTLWRIALDAKNSNDEAAKIYLNQVSETFNNLWKNNSVCSVYIYSKLRISCTFNIGNISGPLSMYNITNRDKADTLMNKYYLPTGIESTLGKLPFYEKSWYWFGLVFYAGYI